MPYLPYVVQEIRSLGTPVVHTRREATWIHAIWQGWHGWHGMAGVAPSIHIHRSEESKMSDEFSNFFEAVRKYRAWAFSDDLPTGWHKKPGPAHALVGLTRCANVNCREGLRDNPTRMLAFTHEFRFCKPECIDPDLWQEHLTDHVFWDVRDDEIRRKQGVHHNILDCALCVQAAAHQEERAHRI